MKVPCRITVEPNTPSRAAANGRWEQPRVDGRPVGSAARTRRTNSDEQRHDGRGRRQRPAAPVRPRIATRKATSRGEQDEARHVDGRRTPGAARSRPRLGRQREADDAAATMPDRHREHEQRAPAEPADEQPADERADRRARRDQQVEQAERLALPLGRRSRRISAAELVEMSAPLAAWPTRDTSRISNDGASAASSDDEGERHRRRRGRPAVAVSIADAARPAARRRPRRGTASRATTTSLAPRPNSSMTPGSATASIVELRGTRIAPLATPSIAGPSSRACARAASQEPDGPRGAVDLDEPPVGDPGRRVAGPDDRRQPELAGHDGRVRQDAAGVRHEAAGDREDRHPRRVRRRADDDVAGLDAAEVVLRRARPAPGRGRRPPTRRCRGARPRRRLERGPSKRSGAALPASAGSTPCRPSRGGVTVVRARAPRGARRPAAAPRRRRAGRRHLVAREEEHVVGASMTPSRRAAPRRAREARAAAWDMPVDPVVVALGQPADLARVRRAARSNCASSLGPSARRARTRVGQRVRLVGQRCRRVSASLGRSGARAACATRPRNRPGSSAHDAWRRSSWLWPRWPWSARNASAHRRTAPPVGPQRGPRASTPGRRMPPARRAGRRRRQRGEALEPALDLLELVVAPADERERLGVVPSTTVVEVGQVLEHLVRTDDRVEVDAPGPADPPPTSCHASARSARSAVSTGRAAIQS